MGLLNWLKVTTDDGTTVQAAVDFNNDHLFIADESCSNPDDTHVHFHSDGTLLSDKTGKKDYLYNIAQNRKDLSKIAREVEERNGIYREGRILPGGYNPANDDDDDDEF